ncbi:GntR family transcriptional regulator [Ralstonia syzygii]
MPQTSAVNVSETDNAVLPTRVRGQARAKIVRPTTVELVINAIRRQILSGELAPGEPLRQEALAEELGVSRLPIREAISRLEAEGMLNVVPHKGAYVCALSVSEIQETFEIRQRLEPWIFVEAIPRMTERDFETAERIVAAMDTAADSEWGHLNWQLHETLYTPAQREMTLAMLKRLHEKADRYFRLQVVNVPIRKQAHEEHMELIRISRDRNLARAEELLADHLRVAAEQIIGVVQKVLTR